jgi:hypothetical protein
VLFIGESPPTSGTFFYDANSILYAATREAFLRAVPDLADEQDFLRAFQRMGCYLEDLSLCPIDRLPKPEKRRARTEAVGGLAERLRGMTPRVGVVVVMEVRPHVERALTTARVSVPEMEALPFPGQWWRKRYVEELAVLVKEWQQKGTLLL